MRVILAAVTGSILILFWGFLSWAALNLHATSGGELPDEAAFVATMQAMNAEDGVYYVPMLPTGDATDPDAAAAEAEAWAERHRQGPLAMIVYHPDGREPMPPVVFVRGLAINFASCLVAALLLASARLRRYPGRVAFVVALGVLVALAADLSYWNWLFYPGDFTAMNMIDQVAAWLLVGLVMAAIVKPRPEGGRA